MKGGSPFHGCNKKAIRKDILENIVIDTIIDELNNPNRINEFVKGIMREQERQFQNNLTLNRLINEKLNTENTIQNIMNAIERGVITNTTTKRLKELEEKQEALEQQIIVERSKASALLKESEIRTYYLQALRMEPKLLMSYLIKQVVVYDDKIEIYFNNLLKTSPDNIDRGFSYIAKNIKISYKLPHRSQMIKLQFDIVIFIF